MATARSTSNGHSGRKRGSKFGAGQPKVADPPRPQMAHRYQSKPGAMQPQSPELGATIRIQGDLRAFLESEQEALARTQALLLCIAHSIATGGQQASAGPYYPGVLELASELVRRRIFNLAELLDGRLPAVVTIC
jgi:hypothetical protein